jgi:hypothetical protein
MGGTLSVGVGSEKDQPQSEKAMGEEPKGIAASSGNRFEGFERDRDFSRIYRQFVSLGRSPPAASIQRNVNAKELTTISSLCTLRF